ncbi:MAG TPA: hypothetical protein DDW65_03110 [Firmicutes bacterium]|nr:hypothetical protein [Bacillota bacterium]
MVFLYSKTGIRSDVANQDGEHTEFGSGGCFRSKGEFPVSGTNHIKDLEILQKLLGPFIMSTLSEFCQKFCKPLSLLNL